jgi:uncharacterized protein YndB with AHSA1/START domain
MENSTEGMHRVVVRRRMPAPREVVFEAWTDPEGIREWMCPGNATSAQATLDVRVGGSFRIVMKAPDKDHIQIGTYQVVDPPSKLVFTWSGPDNASAVTLVTVEFFAHGDESELVITHDKFLEPGLAQRYESGWGTIAEKFATYLHRQKKF